MDDRYMGVRDTDRPVALRRYLRGRGDPGTPAAAYCPGMGRRKRSPANLLASVFGSLTYFATLTEVPILKALLNLGMDKGPPLVLPLVGPTLSLPNMLVIRNVMGTKKTPWYVGLVIIVATVSGMIFGKYFS